MTLETVEELQAQRATLVKAMRSGAMSVQHGDKRVQYRSMDEMRAALASIDSDIASASGTRRSRKTYVRGSRGY